MATRASITSAQRSQLAGTPATDPVETTCATTSRGMTTIMEALVTTDTRVAPAAWPGFLVGGSIATQPFLGLAFVSADSTATIPEFRAYLACLNAPDPRTEQEKRVAARGGLERRAVQLDGLTVTRFNLNRVVSTRKADHR